MNDDSETNFDAENSLGQGSRLSRRRVLQLGAAAMTLPLWAACSPIVAPVGEAVAPVATSVVDRVQIYRETLTVQFAMQTVDGSARRRIVYQKGGGQPAIPGPTIRVKRGRTGAQLQIKLVNQLDPTVLEAGTDNFLISRLASDPGLCPPHDPPPQRFGLLATNLHTHGLHVPPEFAANGELADNIFLALLPTGTAAPKDCHHSDMLWRTGEVQLVFDVRADHPAGTFWYHAHKHGAANLQVMDGLFGALIIEEEEWDCIPEYISSAKEQVIFFAHGTTWLNDKGEDLKVHPIVMRPGEVQRWRIINASPQPQDHIGFNFINSDIEMHMIAFDGLMMGERQLVTEASFSAERTHLHPDQDWAMLSPGNRADFLVRVPKGAPDATVSVRTYEFSNGPGAKREQADFGILRIEGEVMDSRWLDDPKLPCLNLPDLTAEDVIVARQRTVKMERNEEGEFLIEGKHYDGSILQPPMVKGTVEEWTIELVDATDTVHPFHIHVNPFFVTHHDGHALRVDQVRRRWQDTLAIPPNKSITFRTRFDHYAGQFVIHCHNLVHEDRGMMHKVEVLEMSVPETSGADGELECSCAELQER